METRSGRRFRFRRSVRTAGEGRTILEALVGDRLPAFARSVKYHRPRAPFCGVGSCTGCLVRVNGQPSVRACQRTVAEGDRVATENSWPGPGLDLLGVLDVAFPRGVDTLHGFRRPTFAAPLYHRLIRRLAGFGKVPDVPAPADAARAPQVHEARLAVVGAGAAGRAAAARAVALGVRPVVLERDRRPVLVDGAQTLARTTGVVLASPPPGTAEPFTLLGVADGNVGVAVRASSVVVATGGYDGALLFEGSDRPGIVTADLVLGLGRAAVPLPFRSAVVVGVGDRAREVLEALGSRAKAVVGFGEIPPDLTRRASELAVPLYPRSLVVRAVGRRRVRSLELRRRGGGPSFVVPCDAVVLAHRRLPGTQLLFQAGAAKVWSPERETYYPEVGADGATSVRGLFAAGTVAGYGGAAAPSSGIRAVEAALGVPPSSPGPAGPSPAPSGDRFVGYVQELLDLPRRGKWVLCPCEDVLLEEVENAVRRGYRGIEVVKRYTGLGTGLCQGRYCVPEAVSVLAVLEGCPPEEVGSLTPRPPAFPAPLAALAGLHDALGGEKAE